MERERNNKCWFIDVKCYRVQWVDWRRMCKIKNVLKYPLTFCVLITLYFPLFATHVVVDIFLFPLSILKSSHPLHAHLAAARHPLFLYYFSYYYSPHFLICAHTQFNQCTLSESNPTNSHIFMIFSCFFHHHNLKCLSHTNIPTPCQSNHTNPIFLWFFLVFFTTTTSNAFSIPIYPHPANRIPPIPYFYDFFLFLSS